MLLKVLSSAFLSIGLFLGAVFLSPTFVFANTVSAEDFAAMIGRARASIQAETSPPHPGSEGHADEIAIRILSNQENFAIYAQYVLHSSRIPRAGVVSSEDPSLNDFILSALLKSPDPAATDHIQVYVAKLLDSVSRELPKEISEINRVKLALLNFLELGKMDKKVNILPFFKSLLNQCGDPNDQLSTLLLDTLAIYKFRQYSKSSENQAQENYSNTAEAFLLSCRKKRELASLYPTLLKAGLLDSPNPVESQPLSDESKECESTGVGKENTTRVQSLQSVNYQVASLGASALSFPPNYQRIYELYCRSRLPSFRGQNSELASLVPARVLKTMNGPLTLLRKGPFCSALQALSPLHVNPTDLEPLLLAIEFKDQQSVHAILRQFAQTGAQVNLIPAFKKMVEVGLDTEVTEIPGQNFNPKEIHDIAVELNALLFPDYPNAKAQILGKKIKYVQSYFAHLPEVLQLPSLQMTDGLSFQESSLSVHSEAAVLHQLGEDLKRQGPVTWVEGLNAFNPSKKENLFQYYTHYAAANYQSDLDNAANNVAYEPFFLYLLSKMESVLASKEFDPRGAHLTVESHEKPTDAHLATLYYLMLATQGTLAPGAKHLATKNDSEGTTPIGFSYLLNLNTQKVFTHSLYTLNNADTESSQLIPAFLSSTTDCMSARGAEEMKWHSIPIFIPLPAAQRPTTARVSKLWKEMKGKIRQNLN